MSWTWCLEQGGAAAARVGDLACNQLPCHWPSARLIVVARLGAQDMLTLSKNSGQWRDKIVFVIGLSTGWGTRWSWMVVDRTPALDFALEMAVFHQNWRKFLI